MEYMNYNQFKEVHPLAKGLSNEIDIRKCYFNEYMEYIKRELSRTDYQAIKYAEGYYTNEEYFEIKQYRESLREQIRNLEEELSNINIE